MRVKVSVTVEIDPQKWDTEYGTGIDPATVRKDVQTYMSGLVTEQVERLGVGDDTAEREARRQRSRGHQDALNGLAPRSHNRDYMAGWSSAR